MPSRKLKPPTKTQTPPELKFYAPNPHLGYAGSWPCWLFLAAFNFENEKTLKRVFLEKKNASQQKKLALFFLYNQIKTEKKH